MSKNCGFSLLEMVTVLAIVSLLFFTGFSELRQFQQKNAVEAVARIVQAALQFAKTEALINHHSVYIIPLANENNWQEGMVMVDKLPENYKMIVPLQVWQFIHSNVNVRWDGFYGKNMLAFNKDIKRNAMNGKFTIQNSSACKQIIINRLGRLRIISCEKKKILSR